MARGPCGLVPLFRKPLDIKGNSAKSSWFSIVANYYNLEDWRKATGNHVIKLSPQPHTSLAFGLLNTNFEDKSSSAKSTVEPIIKNTAVGSTYTLTPRIECLVCVTFLCDCFVVWRLLGTSDVVGMPGAASFGNTNSERKQGLPL